ncbi:YciI family protein [Streptomyces sp. 5-6(2022)]|uniref:YciI family protein n=1 Tax=Streptomyces sp. 5-6(2022) TaxID=2936510 RepID=UPI0023B9E3C5|nr:YciI family protein [Streptomyces sp. 5-6(2022)]
MDPRVGRQTAGGHRIQLLRLKGHGTMWYLTLHRWSGDRERAIEEALGDHLAWMHHQQLTGRILMAGPSPDRGLGIIVVGHMRREAVDDLFRSEPFVAGGFREYEVIPWEVHHLLGIGGFSVPAVTAMLADERAHQNGATEAGGS